MRFTRVSENCTTAYATYLLLTTNYYYYYAATVADDDDGSVCEDL